MATVEVGCDGILRQLRRRFEELNDKKFSVKLDEVWEAFC